MKRTKLFKSLLVAAALCVGASAWADETKTSVYSNNFETSSDWTAKGKTDGWTCNPGKTTANTFASNVIGVGAGTGDMGLVSPSITIGSDVELVDVEMKFKMDACTGGKSSGIEFITSDVNINNGYVSSGTPFFSINASASGNGYWGTIKVGGNDHTSVLNQASGTYENNSLNRNTTGIVVLNVRFNFTSKVATYTLSKTDGTPLVASTTASFANTNAATLDRIFIHAGKTYGGVTIDDVNVYSVTGAEVAVTYTATFTEGNGLNPTITIFEDAEKSTPITNGLLENKTTYYYTATLAGYNDYEGSFTVDGSNPSVDFTMTAMPTFTLNVFAVDENSNKLLEDPIATSTVYGGQTASAFWSKYIQVDGKWYVSSENSFYVTATEATTKNVVYTLSDIDYFIECENMHGVRTDRWVLEENASNSGYRKIRQNSYYRTIYTDEFAEGGLYKLVLPYNNSNTNNSTSIIQARNAAGETTDLTTFTTANGNHTFTQLVAIPDGCSLAIYYAGDGNSNARMDYLTLTKISSMTIAGSFQGNWNIAEGIAMTQSAENPFIWTATLEDFAIEAKDYKYKATANNKWGVWEIGNSDAEDGNQNYDFSTVGAGYYNLTFTANLTNNTVALAAERVYHYTVVGGFNTTDGGINDVIFGTTWAASLADNDLTANGDGTYSKTFYNVTLDAGNIYYKVVLDYGWDTTWGFNGNNADYGVNAAGTYDITFTFNPTSTLSNGFNLSCDVTAIPSTVTKTITAAGYATYCSPYALDFSESGLTAYIAKLDADGKTAKFTKVSSVPANTGVLLKGDKEEKEYTINTITSSDTNVEDNILVGKLTATQVPAGSFVLLNGDEGVGFYKTTKEFTVGANTAYIAALPEPTARFIGFDSEESTGIEGVAAEQQFNGQVYDLQGRRVTELKHGLYIMNGRKVVVK